MNCKTRVNFGSSIVCVLGMALLLVSCGGSGGPSSGSGSNGGSGSGSGGSGGSSPDARTVLTYAELFSSTQPTAPVNDMQGFAMPSGAQASSDSFEGTLTLNNTITNGSFSIVSDPDGYSSDAPFTHLAPFSFQFVQSGQELIPAQQGLLITGGSWNYIIGPGAVWKESGDHGYSRASFPFALVERNQNCVHDGEMTFLFSNTLTPNISNLRYQVTQETCLYYKVNIWGQTSASYSAGSVDNAATIESAAESETANRLPSKPVSALATDFPGVNVAALTEDFKSPQDITAYGVLVNGTNYVSDCQTRYGDYAFCSEMRLPSYSLAKSAFVATALMHLGQLYSNSTYSILIKNYVPEYTDGGVWTNVNFDQTAEMATGNYISSAYMSDEDSDAEGEFLVAEPFATRIANAFTPFPNHSAPGTTWVYQSHAAFILTVAMDAYLQSQRGSDADIFNLVRDDLYVPLKVSQGGLTTLRTGDSSTGTPFGSHGLFFIQDDIAKIAGFLNSNRGAVNGTQVIDNTRLQESLFRTSSPATVGLQVPDTGSVTVANTFRYNDEFWVKHMTPAEFPQYSCDFWIAFMSGYGGNTVLLMPNGVVYYVFSDGNEFAWYDVVTQANQITPFCPAR
jgi:hypothetical protein